MKKIQPRLVKGSRDFLPEQVSKRKYLLDTIRSVFAQYGFQEIETPAMEMLETLTGKYGDEGDKLLFKILNSGDFLSKAEEDDLREKNSRQVGHQISEKGLRYDLTVPLARYAVQHQHELVFPFRRFHIGPVWRADRPQRGRYREFYQCDADIIGSKSIINEIELTQILLQAFKSLKIEVRVEINHRSILEGIVEHSGLQQHYKGILTAIDKLDKAGKEKVGEELKGLGIEENSIHTLFRLFEITNAKDLAHELQNCNSEVTDALQEIQKISKMAGEPSVVFAPSLARGLDYYTGTIWEVKPTDINMGAIAAGGRYDDLTEMFGGKDMSGVGISFGIERIYDILEEMDGFPADISTSTKVLIVNFDEQSEQAGWPLLAELRARNIASEIYPVAAKLKKQMSYADKKNIPYVVFIGAQELESGTFTLKNMASGEQDTLHLEELFNALS